MEPAEALTCVGGVGSRSRIEHMTSRRAVDGALVDRTVVRVDKLRLRLPDLDDATRLATEMRGHVGVLSAAVAHGWEVPSPPDRPWVVLDHGSRAPARSGRAHIVRGEYRDETALVTSPRRTVLDCARRLPFDQALAVADSALRHGVDGDVLRADAARLRGKGSAQARRVAELASPLPANPFEGLLHARLADAGLLLQPQAPVTVPTLDPGRPSLLVHPDFADVDRRLAVEADSWAFHSSKEAFQRDCQRYILLVLDGWVVLRFTWWQVVHHADWVVACLRRAAVTDLGRVA